MDYLKYRTVFKQVVLEVLDSINGIRTINDTRPKGKWSKEFSLFDRVDANTEIYKIAIAADNRSSLNTQAIDYFVVHLSNMIDEINQKLVEYFREVYMPRDEMLAEPFREGQYMPRVKSIKVLDITKNAAMEMMSMPELELSVKKKDLFGKWNTGVHKLIDISMDVDYINYLTEWFISKIRQDSENFGVAFTSFFGRYNLEGDEIKTIVRNATKGIRENGLNRLHDVRAFFSDMIDYDMDETTKVSDVAGYLYAELSPSRLGKAYKIITIEDLLHMRNIAKEKKLPVEMEKEITSYIGGVKHRKTRTGKKQAKRKQTKKRNYSI